MFHSFSLRGNLSLTSAELEMALSLVDGLEVTRREVGAIFTALYLVCCIRYFEFRVPAQETLIRIPASTCPSLRFMATPEVELVFLVVFFATQSNHAV